jgi:HAL2 family 3'(2'),5'-bisphosphate nucleotidase
MAAGYERELTAGVTAVRRAAIVCRSVQQRLESTETLAKADRSPVTVADYAAQAVASIVLTELLPDDRLVAEEDASGLRADAQRLLSKVVVEEVCNALGRRLGEAVVLDAIDRGRAEPGSGRYWTLDPIDGTKGFLRGGHYAVALALIDKGRVVVGVLGCPNLDGDGALFGAVRGCGATSQPLWRDAHAVPIHVDAIEHPADSRICESVDPNHTNQSAATRIARTLGVTTPPLRMDGSAKYAMVARGDASVYLRLPTSTHYRERIWDHAAGAICVEEAGGRVTDVEGKPLDFTQGRTLAVNRGIVATNGRLHEQVLWAVRQEQGEGGRGKGRGARAGLGFRLKA